MKKSTIFLIIFVAIFFTSTLVLIKLNYLQPQPIYPPKSDITPTIAIDPLANWKSFTDDKLNIQFKYPSQYKLDIIRDGNYYGIYLKGANYRTEGSDMGIMSLGTFFVFSDNKLCKAAPLSELETLIIKNKNYSLYKVKGVEGPDNKVAIIQKNSSGCINFACYSDNLCEGTDLADFQSILPTFKFTDTVQSDKPKSKTVEENGVKLTITPDRGPVGTKVTISITGMVANLSLPFASLSFNDDQGFGEDSLTNKGLDTRTFGTNGSFSTTYTIPAKVLVFSGAQKSGEASTPVATHVGNAFINLSYQDKNIKIPFIVTSN